MEISSIRKISREFFFENIGKSIVINDVNIHNYLEFISDFEFYADGTGFIDETGEEFNDLIQSYPESIMPTLLIPGVIIERYDMPGKERSWLCYSVKSELDLIASMYASEIETTEELEEKMYWDLEGNEFLVIEAADGGKVWLTKDVFEEDAWMVSSSDNTKEANALVKAIESEKIVSRILEHFK